MASFLDFLLPKDTGLNQQQLGYADTQGLLAASAALANLSAPQVGGTKATPMQLIANGMQAYNQGANNSLDSFYELPKKKAAATAAKVQDIYDQQNLDWFNQHQGQGQNTAFPINQGAAIPPPSQNPLASFYAPNSLTAAQIKQESGGNPNAVSPKGAQGLMQIMPATAKAPGMGVTPLQNNTPEENVRFGTDYTNALMQKYNGNKPLALMAYNWGTGNVDNWLASGGDPAKLPAETRDYVQKVLANEQQAGGAPQPQMQPQQGNQAARFYDLAERQMRAGRAGADTLFTIGSKYDPALAAMSAIGGDTGALVNRLISEGSAKSVNEALQLIKGGAGQTGKNAADIANGGQAARIVAAGKQEGEGGIKQLQKQAEIVAKMPLLENDLNSYQEKLAKIDPALMGPLRGTASYYMDPQIQELTSNARSIALQLKDIYNLGSGQGFTDADRNYLDSIIGGAKVDPAAAMPILQDMRQRIKVQKDMYQQQVDFYKQNGTLTGYMPTVNTPAQQQSTAGNGYNLSTPSGVKYRVIQ